MSGPITEKMIHAADKISSPGTTIPTGSGALFLGGLSESDIGIILQVGGAILLALQIVAITPKIHKTVVYWIEWWRVIIRRIRAKWKL